jgi:hypothetical protein
MDCVGDSTGTASLRFFASRLPFEEADEDELPLPESSLLLSLLLEYFRRRRCRLRSSRFRRLLSLREPRDRFRSRRRRSSSEEESSEDDSDEEDSPDEEAAFSFFGGGFLEGAAAD